ncbi:RNA-binding region-containing protein 3-like [Dreissena polymorpha]|uniref:RNA-binding region-containing protein 3 n=1 Tax=Dreissena polymorpha TaxID=45954 RepID=A0A9D4DT13_DREPO|nr:RNA-binding region-containing protein 3-like [Dreissena polymorpha]KAH3753592.1 hypothetical protein DPMN_188232 [Dreissena polymorpha]
MDAPVLTLLVRHLPAELSLQDKIDLLCHFGATSVRPMGITGPMKHTAFARFDSSENAARCLKRLHQLEVLGQRLVVEFAKSDNPCPPSETQKHDQDSKTETKSDTEQGEKKPEKSFIKSNVVASEDISFLKNNINYSRKLNLYYAYPPPTVSTLTNIAHALASHSRFYTQVLHLMNKMNIPCPFGPTTAPPPLAMDDPHEDYTRFGSCEPFLVKEGEIEEFEMEEGSTEESEIDSDEGTGLKRKRGKKIGSIDGSLPASRSTNRPRKKMRLVQPDLSAVIKPAIVQKPSEIFEGADKDVLRRKQINMNIPDVETMFEHGSREKGTRDGEFLGKTSVHDEVFVVEGGFGKVEPKAVHVEPKEDIQKADVNYAIDKTKFLAADKIAEGRLKESQLKDFSVFKNYHPGDPTSRLYIKNLTKQTSEQDLVNLFGSMIDWSLPLAYDVFDVRLMKEGRMKGQAFLTLPDDRSAERIVKQCNGYILNSKPIVIQFSRSAKAKAVDEPLK